MKNPTRTRGERLARFVVWGTWAVLFAAALGFVACFGSNVPYWDDWDLVPVLAGGKPLTWSWLWAETNSHRFPVARLLLWCLARATDGNLRGAMVLTTSLLAGMAALLIRCAAFVRGRASCSDAFFPLLLLHWGHYHSMLWSINLHFASASAVFLLLLANTARGSDVATRSSLPWLITAALLLPLQSAPGLLMTPAVMLWLLYVAIRSAEGPRRFVLVATVVLMGALGLSYMHGLTHVGLTAPPGLRDVLRTSLQFLATAIGPAGRVLWPVSGIAVAGVVAATVVLLLRTWRSRSGERAPVVGILVCILAMVGAALAIGVARSGLGWAAGISPRYVTLACPLLCGVQIAWLVAGRERWRRVGPAALCGCMLVLLPFNMHAGYDWARRQHETNRAFEADLRAGMPPEELAERYWKSVAGRDEPIADRLKMMRSARLGLYAK